MGHDAGYAPHAVCWYWNWWLIALHGVGDLGTAFCYFLIPAIAVYVYRRGHLRGLGAAYPRLWVRGTAFIVLCGVAHLGGFLEIAIGGWLYYLTGANKLAMVGASVLFAREFWRVRNELVVIGRVMVEQSQQESGDSVASPP